MEQLGETIYGIDRNGMAQLGRDANLWVRFFLHPEYQSYRSEKEQRAIYEDREYVEVIQPGAKSSFFGRATRQFIERFPQQYQAFKASQSTAISGTPIDNLPRITPAQKEMLKYMKIFSVEQLAALSDQDLGALGMGGLEMRQAAQNFLTVSKDAAVLSRQKAEIDALRDELKALIEQKTAEPKKRGRPRKTDNEEIQAEATV